MPGMGRVRDSSQDTRRTALILQHQEDDPPALVGEYLVHANFGLDVRRLDKGDPLPADLGAYALLVVLGGDMNVGEESSYPFLLDERELLAEALRLEFPTLGICLGAQQLAVAGEGGVIKRDTLQLGWFPVRYEHFDPFVEEFDRRTLYLQWRRHACRLSNDAVMIADHDGEAQIFRIGERAYGVQFHPEIDRELLWWWLDADPETAGASFPGGLKKLRKLSKRQFYRSALTCGQMMHNFLNVTGARG